MVLCCNRLLAVHNVRKSDPLRATLVTTAKNEAPYFLEWVAYHRLIGFDDILVFQNDSDDGTHDILRALQDLGAIRYFYNRAKRGAHQVRAYKRAARQPAYAEADWVMALDMDEFLTIKAPGGRLRDLLNVLPEADQIHINWRLFSSSDQATLTDDLVTERFVQCDAPERIEGFHTGVKTLFRPGAFLRPGVHKPLAAKGSALRPAVNGSGLVEFPMRKWRSLDPGRRAYAQVNHYVLRDAASFVLKTQRGSAHQADRTVGRHYWRKHNQHRFVDDTLVPMAGAIRQEMARMDAQSGGVLLRLRQAAIDHHRYLFETLQQDPEAAALYAFCLADQQRAETPLVL